ncbi:NHL domain-containing thioredoxin family protein [Yimella sp. NH-Cas1]|uniref:NHL domain-containing thioredoxin family protein n=1 Tax=Yimella sp. NH-Cas1 TaxID=2917726 RepID=UPI001EFB6152|nr:NHL domain-containing thioredoxin family protein [Yimella sp. NH-Cas1]MCG8656538.1 redoxin domain-containing protein [Yimella sp. NH-Cas1]
MVDRLRAPELRGRRWLNTGGEELSLGGLRGRIVVLDFWTFCCVNCLHVLDELRPLEQEFADSLVIIGVHSPKFEHEGRPEAVEAAVERYAVHHPVLDDPDLVTWDAYTARAWPTLVVIDPEGYIVGQMSGEGHGPGIASLVRELISEHSARGTLRRGDSPYVPPSSDSTQFRFPGKAVPLGDGGFVVSDTAHHQIVLLESDLRTERARFGGPEVFEEPQGVCVLPPDAAERLGYDLLVADTVNHRIASIRLSDGRIRTEAGTGEQLRERSGGGAAHKQPLSSPWDIVWWLDRAVIAMAGTHQLWALHLATEPENNTVAVLAGTSAEGLRDGAADEAWLAQPSGLAVSASGDRVWIADSETSALRSIVLDDNGFRLETHIGEGLFDFGFVDGVRSQARMQHPLGVAEAADGTVLVADTYNGAIRRFDPVTQVLSTALTGLSEPSDVLPLDDGLIVVESSAHRVDRMRLPATAAAEGGAGRVRRSATQIAPGAVELVVHFEPPAGQKLDDRYGDPTMLMVSSTPDSLIRSGGGRATGLARALDLDSSVGDGVLHISVRAASCDASGPDGEVPEHAACHLYQQDWGIPVRLEAGADAVLDLDLRGV